MKCIITKKQSNRIPHYDDAKKRTHDSLKVRAKANLKLSHCGLNHRQTSLPHIDETKKQSCKPNTIHKLWMFMKTHTIINKSFFSFPYASAHILGDHLGDTVAFCHANFLLCALIWEADVTFYILQMYT